ncbi:hypothetical protein [Providencia sp. JUb39]|uniref:hypothetical protein n=1 Tax=Providencia sp. JUb39 TaxID=2724165 RepID=UPI00164D3AED|nr:hypothetical protein [Providencia sp. JUb39]MBC5790601.1 hypothetical protein [Providencia sp. JUb39]
MVIDTIYGGITILCIFAGGLWRLHRNQLATESRMVKLEATDELLKQKLNSIHENHTQTVDRVKHVEEVLHSVNVKLGSLDAKFDQVLDLLKTQK